VTQSINLIDITSTINGRERVRFDPINPVSLALKLCEVKVLYSTEEKVRNYRGIYTVQNGSEMWDGKGKHTVSHLDVPEKERSRCDDVNR